VNSPRPGLKIKYFFGRVYFRKKEVQSIKLNSGAELAPKLLSKKMSKWLPFKLLYEIDK
jgi:hypothetical protein